MHDDEVRLTVLDYRELRSGFAQLLPLSLFVVAFGAAFGLAAVQSGLDTGWVVAMSALVFAGYAQFAALDLWAPEVPLLALAATVFAINARHLLMGASLYPWLRHLPPVPRYGVLLLLSDANWALSHQAFKHGRPGLGLLLGGGLALWLCWVLGSWLGARLGNALSDPGRFGLDMVMGCFLLSVAVGGEKSPRLVVTWTVAAGAALLAWRYLPDNTHVVAGALAGGIVGAVGRDSST